MNTECENIIDKLPTLKLKIDAGVTIEVGPRGYVFPPEDGDYYCKIGISGIEGSDFMYRLGTNFLKNFYTVLDFDNNKIMLGSKKDHCRVLGDESMLYKDERKDHDKEEQIRREEEERKR